MTEQAAAGMIGAAPAPRESEHHADESHVGGHESLSFREQVRERVIGIGSMDRRLRLVVGAAIAQLVAAAIMIALRELHLPSLVGYETDSEQSLIAVPTFVVALVFLTVAWGFILAGALHAHWSLRLLALGLFGWVFSIDADTVSGRLGGMVAAAALLAAILAIAVTGMVRDRRAAPAGAQRFLSSRLVLLIPLVGGLYITGWLTSASTGDLDNFTTAIGQQLYFLEYALIPALVLAGADFADWGHLLGTRAGAVLHSARRGWPLLLGAFAVAVAMLVDARRVLDLDFADAIGLGAILVAAVALLAWLARPRTGWPHAFPFAVLAAVVVLDATEGFLVERFVHGSDESISDHIYAISAVFWAAAGIACAAVLVARRGRLRGPAVAGLAFVVLVGVANALFGLSAVAAVFPQLHLSADNAPLDIDGVRAVTAIAAMVVLLVVVATRRVRGAAGLVGALLALEIGVQVLAWVDMLFDRTAQAAETVTRGFSIMAGVVLLLALLLEIVGSGEAITNRHDRWLPRSARVLLYLGYVVLVASAVLYSASLHDPQTGALRETLFDSESWVHEGVLFLGVPLVATLFLGGLRSRRRAAVEEAAAA